MTFKYICADKHAWKMKIRTILTTLAVTLAFSANAQTNQMDINLKKVGAPIQPTMYGIFFEDINFAADGKIYPIAQLR